MPITIVDATDISVEELARLLSVEWEAKPEAVPDAARFLSLAEALLGTEEVNSETAINPASE